MSVDNFSSSKSSKTVGKNSTKNEKNLKKAEKVENFVGIRSFLGGNVDILLENLAARRESRKNDSEDIFAEHSSPSIKWKTPIPKTKLQVLIEEKNALGLYMSGKPLEEYKEIEKWLQKTLNKWNLRLMFVNKVRKIFTKAGAMMFTLEVSLTETDIEAVIFPKNAMELSPLLAENELFWVVGNIQDKRREKKTETIPEILEIETEKSETENLGENLVESLAESGENSENEEVFVAVPIVENAYQEKPKFLIESLTKSENGPKSILESYDLPNLDWKMLRENLPKFFENLKNDNSTNSSLNSTNSNFSDSQNPENENQKNDKNTNLKILKLSQNLGQFALEIKKNLSKQRLENAVECELWISNGGEFQKAKGTFWLPQDVFEKYEKLVK